MKISRYVLSTVEVQSQKASQKLLGKTLVLIVNCNGNLNLSKKKEFSRSNKKKELIAES